MGIRSDIKRVLVLGSGPIVVGQGAEFDYAGTQACISYKSAGLDVIVLNDNHASYMTTGFDNITVELAAVTAENAMLAFQKHNCDAIAASFGGQTALNIVAELIDNNLIREDQLLGTPRSGIEKAENRRVFAVIAEQTGAPCAQAVNVSDADDCVNAIRHIGLPCIIRASYTLGGAGTKMCHSLDEMISFVKQFSASESAACIAERSLLDLIEIEFEIVRDCKGNAIAVCGMENIDPVGIHTGDSVVVAPIQTLDDELVQDMRSAALQLVNEIGVIGACNVQFAVDAQRRQWWTIECNPRTSRSSALASKATGYPIARVAAQLSLGKTLDEVHIGSTGVTAALEPALDYVVVKIPAWSDTRFRSLSDGELLSSSMRATGESMGIGLTFAEAYFKALRDSRHHMCEHRDSELNAIPSRPIQIVSELLKEVNPNVIANKSKWRLWFVNELRDTCVKIRQFVSTPSVNSLRDAKLSGAPDYLLSSESKISEADIVEMRHANGITPGYQLIDGTACELSTKTKYTYSTYRSSEKLSFPSEKRTGLIIGSGPIVIGQGIEFDCCSTEAVIAVRNSGLFSAVLNSNPETVSTDYDMSDALIFDPVDCESVSDIAVSLRDDSIIFAQFGGQVAINAVSQSKIASKFATEQLSVAAIAGDRERFADMTDLLGIARPPRGTDTFPIIVRPSHVIGGVGMTVVTNSDELHEAVKNAVRCGAAPVICDQMIDGIEFDVDMITTHGGDAIAFVSEQLDPAGIHSGDSIAVWPARHRIEADIAESAAKKIACAAGAVGITNTQIIVKDKKAYVIELNARASRTTTFISKAAKINLVSIAINALLNSRLDHVTVSQTECKKMPVFSKRLPVTALGPMMTSTGERFVRSIEG